MVATVKDRINWVRASCALNAAFLLLAACRALLPGACMTQLTARDAIARDAAEQRACCQIHRAGEGDQWRAQLPERGPCGLCHLAKSMVQQLIAAQPQPQWTPDYPDPCAVANPAPFHAPSPRRDRAPPPAL